LKKIKLGEKGNDYEEHIQNLIGIIINSLNDYLSPKNITPPKLYIDIIIQAMSNSIGLCLSQAVMTYTVDDSEMRKIAKKAMIETIVNIIDSHFIQEGIY